MKALTYKVHFRYAGTSFRIAIAKICISASPRVKVKVKVAGAKKSNKLYTFAGDCLRLKEHLVFEIFHLNNVLVLIICPSAFERIMKEAMAESNTVSNIVKDLALNHVLSCDGMCNCK